MSNSSEDRQYMLIAIEEMLKSRGEHTEKPDPFVGAVLVDSENVELGRAFRGGLRVGDHAEYQLIERYMRDKDLEGSTLYVTLEPCIDDRDESKTPCAERIVSARIGRVVVGIPDPNPKIRGRGIQHLLNNQIEVEFFNFDLMQRIQEQNAEFIDYFQAVESTEEEATFEGPSDTENEAVQGASVADFSTSAIETYLNHRNREYKIPSTELWEFMLRNGYLRHIEASMTVPTKAGILLFGKQPDEFLPQAKVMVQANHGDKTITDEWTGPLIEIRDKIDRFFKDNMREYTRISGFDRTKVFEYPLEAIREAVFNAITHRDYVGGAKIQVKLFKDRIDISSPGTLLKPITIQMLREFNAPQFSRNPRIAVTLQQMGLIDEVGSGLRRMRDSMVRMRLRPPEFSLRSGYLVTTLLGEAKSWRNLRVEPDFLLQLDPELRDIVTVLEDKQRLSSRECSKLFEIDVSTSRRRLAKLRTMGVIKSVGRGPKSYYVLAD